MNLPTETRASIEAHYRRHEETYSRIWGQLDRVHDRFLNADRTAQTAYLKLSYVNSLISIQTPLHIHEEAFNRVMAGESLEEAFTSVNYNRQKIRYGRQTLTEAPWDEIVTQLTAGDVDVAHKTALDRLKFVGTVKVPFTLAMLGYTEKMCLDANVLRLMGIEEQPSTVVVDRYESLCEEVRAQLPQLSEELDPYHLQWVMFDFQRFNRTGMSDASAARHQADQQVAYHKSWFDAALRPTDEIIDVTEAL